MYMSINMNIDMSRSMSILRIKIPHATVVVKFRSAPLLLLQVPLNKSDNGKLRHFPIYRQTP
jgi:hypothetical protein